MNCPKCDGNMEWQNGGDYGDSGYKFDEWMECDKCGYETDVPNDTTQTYQTVDRKCEGVICK